MAEKCPFCEGTMTEVEKFVLDTGVSLKVRCVKCGFQAAFMKPLPKPKT